MTSFLETLATERLTRTASDTSLPAWVKTLRDHAWQTAVAAGLPTTRHESWKFTSLRPLSALTAKLPESAPWEFLDDEAVNQLREVLDTAGLNLVFVDGVFAHDLSGAGPEADDSLHDAVLIEDLAAALRGPASNTLQGLVAAMDAAKSKLPVPLARVAPQEQTIASLGDSMISEGVMIQIPAGKNLKSAIRMIHVSTGRATAGFSRHILSLGAGSTARLTECYLKIRPSDGQISQFVTTDVHLSENSRLRHDRLLARTGEFHFGATNVIVPAGATYHSLALNLSARIGRHNITAMITGGGADVVLDGLTTSRADQVLDTQSAIDHRVPHTTSRQLYKSLLKETSRSVFAGKIFVRKNAQKTAAFQQSKSLLLSNDAEVDAKPQLEIEADDVRCSHGATVAQLNPDEMFYLQSRGIPHAKAEAMLCEAFAAEIWQTAQDPWLEARARAELTRFFA